MGKTHKFYQKTVETRLHPYHYREALAICQPQPEESEMIRLPAMIRQGLLVLAGLVFVVGLFLVALTWVLDSWGGEQVTVAKNEVISDDLYVSGVTVTIDDIVRGDVIGVGRQIAINGTVDGDLVAANQTIVINGTVNDDVRTAG